MVVAWDQATALAVASERADAVAGGGYGDNGTGCRWLRLSRRSALGDHKEVKEGDGGPANN